jgi:O-antigen/teichoic acid export membrane protein
MHKERDEKKIVFWNSTTFIFSFIVNFIVYTLYYKTFPPEIFGIYLTAISIFLLGNSLDLGIGISSIKVISEKRIISDSKYIDSFVSTFIFVYAVIGLVISTLLYLNYILSFKILPNGIINSDYFFLKIVLYFFIVFINGFFKVILEGFYEYVLVGKMTLCIAFINLIVSIIIYYYSLSIDYLLDYNVILSLLQSVLFILFIIFKTKVNIKFNLFNTGILKNNIRHSLNIQISYILGNSIEYIVRFLIGYFISFASVTYYENARKVVNIINGLITSSQRSLLNKLSEFQARGTLKDFLSSEFLTFPKISNSYSAFIFGALNIVICSIIFFWFKNYDSILIYSLLCIAFSLINFATPFYNLLLVNNDGKYLILIQAINFISTIFFLLCFLFFYQNEMGIVGYVISTILNVYVILRVVQSKYGLTISAVLKETNGVRSILFVLLLVIQAILLFTTKINFLYIASSISIICVVLNLNQTKYLFATIRKLRI